MFCLTIFPLKHNIIVWFEIDFMRQNIKMVSESSLERTILKRTFVLLFFLYDKQKQGKKSEETIPYSSHRKKKKKT